MVKLLLEHGADKEILVRDKNLRQYIDDVVLQESTKLQLLTLLYPEEAPAAA